MTTLTVYKYHYLAPELKAALHILKDCWLERVGKVQWKLWSQAGLCLAVFDAETVPSSLAVVEDLLDLAKTDEQVQI